MNTKNWNHIWDCLAIQKAGVRPWFQRALLQGGYFFFNTVNGRVLCLGTCPSTSLAFSYTATFTALPITVFVVGPTGPVIAQAGDPDAGELYTRWLEYCELEAKEKEEKEKWISHMLDHQSWRGTKAQHQEFLEAQVRLHRGDRFFFEEVNGRVLCLGTCLSSSLAFSYTAPYTALPITVFVVDPTGPVMAQAGDPDAAEVYARFLEHYELMAQRDADDEREISAELDDEIWLETMEQNREYLAAEEREAAQAVC